MHLDGFADACDALFVATSRERRLEILRDVHLGAFGAVGLMLLLLTKVAALDSTITFAPLVLAPVLSRMFRDWLGWFNQRLAAEANAAYFMVAGLPIELKWLSSLHTGDGSSNTALGD